MASDTERRLELHALLVELLGSENVYHQPPPMHKMLYPAIRYKRDDEDTSFADNKPYSRRRRYSVTYIDRSPDSDIPAKIAQLPMCTFDRNYAADGLNHDVYNLFF